jgi:gliding motility-associated protein GldM
MGGEKLSPRQQMISLMYLVLLAMLAMNASKSLLDAFVMLEKGIGKTVESFNTANSGFYNTIDKAAASSSVYASAQEKAYKLKAKAQECIDLINAQKIALITKSEMSLEVDTSGFRDNYLDGNKIPLNKDDQDYGATYFTVLENGANGDALKKLVDEFRELVIEIVDNDGDKTNDGLIEKYKELLDTETKTDPLNPDVETTFASRMSEHLPLAAVTANLSLVQSYVRNAEADVVSSIASKMDGAGMVVDKAEGMVKFSSGYVLKNDSVYGDVFMAAYNSKINPKIYIGTPDTNKFKENGGSIQYAPGTPGVVPMLGDYTAMPVQGGKGRFQVYADQVGQQELSGVIEVVSAKGTFYYPYKSSYMVAEPSATVAASKMNVFYVGVPNPIQVSAPGVSLEDIKVVGAGGLSISPLNVGKGEYKVTAKTPTKSAFVTVQKKDGTTLGKSEFRVKTLPTPAASLLGMKEGMISKGQLKAASFLKAEMENFDFDLQVKVVSFDMSMSLKGDLRTVESKSQMLTTEMQTLLGRATKGTKIYFENVKAKMPDGSVRSLGSISFKVK